MKRKSPTDKDGNTILAPEAISVNLQAKRVTENGAAKDMALVRQTREYELITPLFGGGTETQKADPVSVIRVPSIRGQLRFWWRACRAAQFSSIAEMKKVEDSIWGSTETPSAVMIELQIDDKGTEETAYWMEWNQQKGKLEIKNSSMIAPYAAFPLQPDKDEQKERNWRSEPVVLGVCFTLNLRFPNKIRYTEKVNGQEKTIDINEVEKEVTAALWAWETFGGVGARTRRGFGALRLIKENNKPAKVWSADVTKLRAELMTDLTAHVLQGTNHAGVPQLSHDVPFKFIGVIAASNDSDVKKKTRANAVAAWKSLIKQFNEFRQDRYGGRFGKSKWPEANEIRGRAGLPLRIAIEAEGKELVHKFPRAVFGLPIVFHLPHDKGKPDFHLIGKKLKDDPLEKDIERLSSPLILRPLSCEGGKAVGLALILKTEKIPPQGLYLKGKAKNDPQPDAKLGKDEALLIEPLNGKTDVLQAFLDKLK